LSGAGINNFGLQGRWISALFTGNWIGGSYMFNNKKINFVLFLLTVLFITISLVIPYKQALVFLQIENNSAITYIPLVTGDSFKIKYKHSIHLTDVIESYRVTKQGNIRQYELEYENYAIGMPSGASEGEIFEAKDGKYYIKNMKRDFPSFVLRVGQVRANHTLLYKNKAYPLAEYIEPGTRVIVQIKKLNVIQQLRGVSILDDK
jgi:hypothetical protein